MAQWDEDTLKVRLPARIQSKLLSTLALTVETFATKISESKDCDAMSLALADMKQLLDDWCGVLGHFQCRPKTGKNGNGGSTPDTIKTEGASSDCILVPPPVPIEAIPALLNSNFSYTDTPG